MGEIFGAAWLGRLCYDNLEALGAVRGGLASFIPATTVAVGATVFEPWDAPWKWIARWFGL